MFGVFFVFLPTSLLQGVNKGTCMWVPPKQKSLVKILIDQYIIFVAIVKDDTNVTQQTVSTYFQKCKIVSLIFWLKSPFKDEPTDTNIRNLTLWVIHAYLTHCLNSF